MPLFIMPITHPPIITSHHSPLTSHRSPLTSHLSPLACHLSPLTPHLSPSHLSPSPSHPLTLMKYGRSFAGSLSRIALILRYSSSTPPAHIPSSEAVITEWIWGTPKRKGTTNITRANLQTRRHSPLTISKPPGPRLVMLLARGSVAISPTIQTMKISSGYLEPWP